MAHDLVTELLQYSSLACFMPIWQLCANLLIPNCLRSNLSYSPLAALELYVNDGKFIVYPDGKNLTISLPLENAETAEVKIVNTAGIMVASTIVNGQIASYKVNLMSGVYVAIAKTSAGRIYKAKPFVIR